ncbi:hypothetical protein UFOVP1601_39 [uncultured Caudovirales phage]|uniref:Uncharacterized protein n=1 Tax=uncultured Caudovirales phage TaxID=2100421 RepID=A0A6J5ST85_9CAUD|nr:hypothetical protein UFOVP1154_49 [uncultured Caudovirales phage]CAB4200533.1 hypothetical protein UFOVP1341_44 [uncultured Caudovirales phage]CAB4218782.1 hypothetical protein UFOVP1601_39 [uncultured Caudovirales phage]
MKRQLQIKNGIACAEWSGGGGMPVTPDDTWTFLDVSDRKDAPQVGHRYDAASDTFTPPSAPPDYGRTVSAREFLQLFTSTERKAIRAAGKTDEDIADWFAIAQVPEPIRLKHPTTIGGLNFIVAKGLLTAARRDAILAG